jgi:hypothetical protein
VPSCSSSKAPGEYAKVTPASSVLAGLKAARAALDRAITVLERAREDG